MKTKTLSLITGVIAVSAALFANPGSVHDKVLTLSWNAPEAEDTVQGYKLYVATNLPSGMPVPVPSKQELLTFALPAEATNQFTLFMTIPGDATSVSLTNIWSKLGQRAFFTLTATNDAGESTFSNPAHIPAPPTGAGKDLKVEFVR